MYIEQKQLMYYRKSETQGIRKNSDRISLSVRRKLWCRNRMSAVISVVGVVSEANSLSVLCGRCSVRGATYTAARRRRRVRALLWKGKKPEGPARGRGTRRIWVKRLGAANGEYEEQQQQQQQRQHRDFRGVSFSRIASLFCPRRASAPLDYGLFSFLREIAV